LAREKHGVAFWRDYDTFPRWDKRCAAPMLGEEGHRCGAPRVGDAPGVDRPMESERRLVENS
jgi:hypothetical protein